MSDGGRERGSLGVGVWKSSQKWSARRSAVRSIAWLGLGVTITNDGRLSDVRLSGCLIQRADRTVHSNLPTFVRDAANHHAVNNSAAARLYDQCSAAHAVEDEVTAGGYRDVACDHAVYDNVI